MDAVPNEDNADDHDNCAERTRALSPERGDGTGGVVSIAHSSRISRYSWTLYYSHWGIWNVWRSYVLSVLCGTRVECTLLRAINFMARN